MHRNISRSVESLSVHSFLLPETRLWYFWHQDIHKQLFLKGGKRKLPTWKINAVDYSESKTEALDRKWKEQIVSSVNIIVRLQHSFCPHAHTLYLTKTTDKAARMGRWLSGRKWMVLIFPTLLIFPFMQYSCNCLIPGGHIKTRMTGYSLCFLLEPFLAYVGVSKKKKKSSFDISLIWEWIFCSINSLISTSYHFKVKFVPPSPLTLSHSLHRFIPTEI